MMRPDLRPDVVILVDRIVEALTVITLLTVIVVRVLAAYAWGHHKWLSLGLSERSAPDVESNDADASDQRMAA